MILSIAYQPHKTSVKVIFESPCRVYLHIIITTTDINVTVSINKATVIIHVLVAVADGSEHKGARDFLATPIFTLATPTRDRKWRVLSSLLGSRRPEFAPKYL